MDITISSRVWASNLTTSEKMVLLALDHLGDSDGFSWYGYERLSDITGINLESKYLTRIINKLEKEGYILIWRQHGRKGGRGYTHIYWPIIGRTNEEILEITMRRFIATEDEATAILNQSGPVYEELVKRNRVSGDTLANTRDKEKGVLSTPIKSSKGVPETPNTSEGGTENTQNGEKGVLGTPRIDDVVLDKKAPPFEVLYKRWLDSLGELNIRLVELLGDYYDEHPDWVAEIMDIVIGAKPERPWQYFVKIINKWVKYGKPVDEPEAKAKSPPATASPPHKNGVRPPIDLERLKQEQEALPKGS